MKRIQAILQGVFAVIMTVAISFSSVLGASAMSMQPTDLPKNGSLIITAYKALVTDTTPTASASNKLFRIGDVELVQLYNSGSVPVNVAEWRIVDSANPLRELQFDRSSRSGWLEPGKHVVVASGLLSMSSTYHLAGWDREPINAVKVPGLSLVHTSYRSSQVDVSGSNILRKRVFGSTSYNTSFQDAVAPSEITDNTMTNSVLFDDGLYMPPIHPGIKVVEVYPYSSNCDPFDMSVLCSDYVKLYNPSSNGADLEDIVLRTDSSSSSRTSSNTIRLSGILGAGEYLTISRNDVGAALSLTNSGGYVWLEDLYGLLSGTSYDGTVTRYESAGSSLQGFSYAMGQDGVWQWSSTPMPGGENVITPPAEVPCPDGKYRNPETNRCRTLEDTLNALSTCEEGYERNPLTNRCRKTGGATTSSLTPCKEGQVRNPETSRCRSIASEVADLIPCNDGYERNPETNRCRKAQAGSEVKGAEYPVVPVTEHAGNAAGMWTLAGVAAVAAAYAVWEWRHEIGNAARSLWLRLRWWQK